MLSPWAPQPQLHPLIPIAGTMHSLTLPHLIFASAVSLIGYQSCCMAKLFPGETEYVHLPVPDRRPQIDTSKVQLGEL